MIQLAQGKTSPSDWKNYKGLGIYVDVDTSAGNFTETPHYLVSLEGESHHWCANGTTSVYKSTKKSFRVYLRWTDDAGHYQNHNPLRAAFAKQLKWHLKWTGIGMCPKK